ncbi:MAG: glycosyltransferase-like protein [uncultured bacterium]|nr:MAG: glycosyltransferase-like protein [uncultured bacterium]HBR71548.1 hypothetical protein [Candidatus Moranbacteria bacterium]
MKIFLPFAIKDVGGPSSFAKKFKEGMERRGHEVFFEHQSDYDVIFLIVQAPFKYLFEAKIKNKKIIQRLDGVYYWSAVGPKYFLYNLKAKIIQYFFADFTVYQSEYSKYTAEKFLKKNAGEKSTIIFNGVDLNIFSPKGEKNNLRDNHDQKIFFTVSAFRREEQIIPLLEALKIYYDKYNNNFKFIVAGTFTPNIEYIPKKYSYFKNIKFIGKIDNKEIPKYERSADVFLFTQINPPCPNNIIEALACGLPICGVADGAMPEIIKNKKGGLLITTSGNAFWKQRVLNLKDFTNNLNKIILDKEYYSTTARNIAEKHFSIDYMLDKYINILRNI